MCFWWQAIISSELVFWINTKFQLTLFRFSRNFLKTICSYCECSSIIADALNFSNWKSIRWLNNKILGNNCCYCTRFTIVHPTLLEKEWRTWKADDWVGKLYFETKTHPWFIGQILNFGGWIPSKYLIKSSNSHFNLFGGESHRSHILIIIPSYIQNYICTFNIYIYICIYIHTCINISNRFPHSPLTSSIFLGFLWEHVPS